ncbi:hypothetical protein ACKI16_23825 [Streptomyces scabiei]|uniref:hypothetical protein n=1 Tax=Streptomyces scabiei TaxID=1930 RepID=UPI0038F605D7
MGARKPEYTVKRVSDRTTVEEGDELLVDDNLPVTFLGIASPPYGDDESGEWNRGQISVRYSWGAVESVKDTRARVTVDEV